jgi:hypothetical protein
MLREKKREVGGSERHYRGWEEEKFNIRFEGSQALSVCPSGNCKHLTGTIKVQFYGAGGRGCV